MLLCEALQTLFCPNGIVVGVLPEFRVGSDVFEAAMIKCGFNPIELLIPSIPSLPDYGGRFQCAGGSSVNYRLISWSDCRS